VAADRNMSVQILTIPMTPFVSNCYVVRDAGEALVVDPGDVTSALRDALKGHAVRAVVNTHGHCDHCGGNAQLVAETGAELLAHEADLDLLRGIEDQGLMFGVPFQRSPDPTRYIGEGDVLTAGQARLTVLHVPGHTPGHVALRGEGFVMVGDILFNGSIGRTDLPGGDYEQLLESIRTRLLTLPDDTVVYCGHGPRTTIGVERQSNPFLQGL